MKEGESESLVALNFLTIREGIVEGLLEGLVLKGPFRPNTGGLGHCTVAVSWNSEYGGITSHLQFSDAEIDANEHQVIKLLHVKGHAVGAEIADQVHRDAARALAWQRTGCALPSATWWYRTWLRYVGRWRRLRWAWTGFIPIDP